jgi:alpha/beta superfamily hydrolase
MLPQPQEDAVDRLSRTETRACRFVSPHMPGLSISTHLTDYESKGGLRFLEETLSGRPKLQAVVGYSFGSYVGAQVAASDPRVHFYLGIGPPLNHYDLGILKAAPCAIALIAGTRDEFCERARLEAFSLSLPATPWLRLLETDHFFTDALDDLAQACRDASAWALTGR